jgi:ornithine--oxo-acid transaminase
MPGFEIIAYDDVHAMEKALANPHVCGLWIEPIQGEAGVYVPHDGYLKAAADLCKKHNVLLMMDEIQTGIARTGKMLASDHEGVRPDMLILGKALSGGVLPISVVLADDEIMLVIKPGEHGSTFGGNPLSAAVCMEALQVIKDEKLADNAARLGEVFRERMRALMKKTHMITLVRGKGLLNAIVINDSPESETAWNLCMEFAKNGLLAKPTHGNIIRLAPPLVITEEQIHECCDIIEKCVLSYKK